MQVIFVVCHRTHALVVAKLLLLLRLLLLLLEKERNNGQQKRRARTTKPNEKVQLLGFDLCLIRCVTQGEAADEEAPKAAATPKKKEDEKTGTEGIEKSMKGTFWCVLIFVLILRLGDDSENGKNREGA